MMYVLKSIVWCHCPANTKKLTFVLNAQPVKPLGYRVKSIWNKNTETQDSERRRKGMKNDACNLFCGGYVTEAQQDDIFKSSPVQR